MNNNTQQEVRDGQHAEWLLKQPAEYLRLREKACSNDDTRVSRCVVLLELGMLAQPADKAHQWLEMMISEMKLRMATPLKNRKREGAAMMP